MSPAGDPYLDAAGCLTETGLALVRDAAPGRTPADVAAHVAACGRCQRRLLEEGSPRPRKRAPGRGPRPLAPSLGKLILLAALTLLAFLVALLTLRRLAGQ